MEQKTLVIGLDGATLATLKPWMDAGKLPNLKKLADRGTVGNLTSVIPYVSPVAWSSFMTGNNPGNHGVYGFQQCNVGEYKPFITMSRDVKAKTLWRILSDEGHKVVVVNVLMTYPLEDVNGIIVGDLLSPGIKAKPKSLEPWLTEEGYIIEGKGFMNTEKDEFLESLYETTDKRVDVALKLMDKQSDWEFYMLLISGTDRIQHYLWGDMLDKDPKYGDAIEKYYIHVDSLVGQLIDKAGPDTNIIILSDHGFGRQRKRVHINHWLIENKFMKVEDSWENKKTWWTIRLSGFLKDTGAGELIRKALVNFYGGKQTDMQPPKIQIDYSKNTSVFTCGYYTGQLYMNHKLSPEEYQTERARLIEKIKDLRDPETGEKILENVYTKEEVYSGAQLQMAPDVILMPKGDYWIVGGLNYHKLIESVFRDTGEHRIDGMIMLAGPDFKKNQEIIDANLIDVAPTVLKLFGLEAKMDGKPIDSALIEKSG